MAKPDVLAHQKVFYIRGALLLDSIIMGIIATAYMTEGDYLTEDEVIQKIHDQSMAVVNGELIRSRLADLVKQGKINIVQY